MRVSGIVDKHQRSHAPSQVLHYKQYSVRRVTDTRVGLTHQVYKYVNVITLSLQCLNIKLSNL